jgi:hypothetical protein
MDKVQLNKKAYDSIVSLHFNFIKNNVAHDDELAQSWDELKQAFYKLQNLMTTYISEVENGK